MFNIKEFQAEINTTGVLPSNRYVVSFAPPEKLRDNVFSGELGPRGSTPNNTSLSRMSLRCEAVQFPGASFAAVEGIVRYGYGPVEAIPYVPVFDDVSLLFLVDRESDVHRFFHRWMNIIVNYNAKGLSLSLKEGPNKRMRAFEVGYKDDYTTNIEIAVYGSDNRKVMTARLYKAYPKSLPPIDLGWGNDNQLIKINIPFAYTDFDIVYENNLPVGAPVENQVR
jgi:hypothetical protein